VAEPLPGRKEWWWCDALYMAPPALVSLSKITGETKYIDFMNKLWWDSYEFLYDKEEKLFYRDDRFIIKSDGSGRREQNGKKVFWSRGNGWVLAGIARVLQNMPENYPDRNKYIQLFKDLAERIAKLQGNDGLWKTSLLNPDAFTHGETSGSGFFCYAMAWGINNGILSKDTYLPVVLKAWNGMNKAIQPSGKLGWVQKIGFAPGQITEDMTEVYGVGAFLLSGSELLKMK
jgi:unsaturated rhamnogalacturonyl hydrolase